MKKVATSANVRKASKEPIAKIISVSVFLWRNHATLDIVLMALATSYVTALELVLKVNDVKTTFRIARLIHATGMDLALMESMAIAVIATQVILAQNVNIHHALPICVNMVVLALMGLMAINVIVLQGLMVQIVKSKFTVSPFQNIYFPFNYICTGSTIRNQHKVKTWLDQIFRQIYQKLMLNGFMSSENLCLIHYLKFF